MNTSDVIYDEHGTSRHEVQVIKQPKTYEQQVEIIKSKGFVVNNDTECIKFLEQANYYRLSAYFLPFRKKDGTYFEDINFIEYNEFMNLIADCVDYCLIV